MPAPYSYDMRKKALAAVRRGERKKEVSQMFNISRNTLDLWLKREEKTGDCRAITNYQINREVGRKSRTGRDLVSLPETMVGTRKEKWLSLWGDKVTQQNLSDALAKIRWSRKKRLTGIENEMNLSAKYFNNN